jgi:hypothetical protein
VQCVRRTLGKGASSTAPPDCTATDRDLCLQEEDCPLAAQSPDDPGMNPVAIRELQDALHAALEKCDVSSDDASGAVKARLLFLQHLHLVRHCVAPAPSLSAKCRAAWQGSIKTVLEFAVAPLLLLPRHLIGLCNMADEHALHNSVTYVHVAKLRRP